MRFYEPFNAEVADKLRKLTVHVDGLLQDIIR